MAIIQGTNRDDLLQASSPTGDTLHGLRGNDELIAGPGDDILNGGSGNDVLSAAGGRDRLFAGTGNDRLQAGTELTAMTGGEGLDTFVITPDAGNITIADFTRGTDTFLISDFDPQILDFRDLSPLITRSGTNSIVDFSEAVGAEPGTLVMTVLGVTNLRATDFDFSTGEVFLFQAEDPAAGGAAGGGANDLALDA